MEANKVDHVLLWHGFNVNRALLWKHVGKEVTYVAGVKKIGSRIKKSGNQMKTLLLIDVMVMEENTIDHCWIDAPKRFPKVQIGDTLCLKGKVKVYSNSRGIKNFGFKSNKVVKIVNHDCKHIPGLQSTK